LVVSNESQNQNLKLTKHKKEMQTEKRTNHFSHSF